MEKILKKYVLLLVWSKRGVEQSGVVQLYAGVQPGFLDRSFREGGLSKNEPPSSKSFQCIIFKLFYLKTF